MLRDAGVEAESEQTSGGFTIREHTCPYAKTAGEHPEICSVIHSVMTDVVAPQVRQTDSLATGGSECRFEITTGTSAVPEFPVGPAQEQRSGFREVSKSR
jgi:predicted ArsR family transcriptional regulator